MRVRFYSIAMLCLLLPLAVVSGCRSRMDLRSEVTEIRMLTWGKQEDIKVFSEMLDMFHAKHPDIRVKVEFTTYSGMLEKLLISSAGGRAPDVTATSSAWFGSCAEKGLLEPLDDYVKTDAEFDLEDFYEPALNCMGWYKGRLYAVPAGIDIYAVFYNKTMFDRHGVPYPDDSWDWDRYVSAAKRLTRDLNGDGKPDQWGAYPDIWQNYVWQNGGDILTADGKRCLLDQHAAYEGIQFGIDLRGKYGVAPGVTDVADIGPVNLFVNGKLGMYTSGSWAANTFNKMVKDFEYDVGPLPKGKKRATIIAATGYGITKASKHKKQAWEFVRHMSSPEVQRLWAVKHNSQPSRKSVADSGDFLKPTERPRNRRVFVDAVDYAHLIPPVACAQEMNDIINNEISLATLGKEDVVVACKRAARVVNELLNYYED